MKTVLARFGFILAHCALDKILKKFIFIIGYAVFLLVKFMSILLQFCNNSRKVHPIWSKSHEKGELSRFTVIFQMISQIFKYILLVHELLRIIYKLNIDFSVKSQLSTVNTTYKMFKRFYSTSLKSIPRINFIVVISKRNMILCIFDIQICVYV